MSISVVILVSATAAGLERCLNALLDQVRPPKEVIVVCRGADSEVSEFAMRWRAKSAPVFDIKIVKVPEGGLVKSLNAGTECASSPIICFTCDDCKAHKSWLSTIHDDFEDPLTGAVGGPVIGVIDGMARVTYADDWGRISWWGRRRDNMRSVPRHNLYVERLHRCNMAFRAHLLRGFDQRLLGDEECEEDMCLAIKSAGFRVVCDPAARMYRHAQASTSAQHRKPISLLDAHHDNTYLFLKHSTVPQKVVFIPYTFLIGDDLYPGLFRFLATHQGRTRSRPPTREIMLALRGKALGIRTYFSYLNGRSRPYRY